MSTTPAAVRASQFVIAGLIFGLASFAGVVIFLRMSGHGAKTPATPMLSYVAPAVWFLTTGAAMFLPGIILKAGAARHRGQGDSWLPPVFQTATIARGAMLDGGALLCAVAVLTEGQWALLALVAGSVLAMMATFPTPARYEDARRRLCS